MAVLEEWLSSLLDEIQYWSSGSAQQVKPKERESPQTFADLPLISCWLLPDTADQLGIVFKISKPNQFIFTSGGPDRFTRTTQFQLRYLHIDYFLPRISTDH
jgi:hypothetical protein